MQTLYDWVTVGIFAAMVTHYIAQSAKPEGGESIWPYLGGGVACGAANWLGNHGWHLAAWAIIVVVVGAAMFIVRRGRSGPRSH